MILIGICDNFYNSHRNTEACHHTSDANDEILFCSKLCLTKAQTRDRLQCIETCSHWCKKNGNYGQSIVNKMIVVQLRSVT